MPSRLCGQILTVSIICLVHASIAGGQTTWYVDAANCPGPGDGSQGNPFCQIQSGIAASVNGDTILVADGVYTGTGNKGLDFGGKLISLRSVSDNPAACIIDCEGSGRGFYFHSGETAVAVVQGFTIRNGYVTTSSPGSFYGGGVYCATSSPTLANCTISSNTASGSGGGVFLSFSNATLTNCRILKNTSPSLGGGVYSENSAAVLSLCTVRWNTAVGSGGGVYAGNVTLTNCLICDNSVSSSSIATPACGAGVYCGGAITNCVISANMASAIGAAYGAGVYTATGASLLNCTISGNSGFGTNLSQGGGVYCGPGTNLTNCAIIGNTVSSGTDSYGGGVHCGAGATLTNCSISKNAAGSTGGGLRCASTTTSPTLTNCILWNDSPQEVSFSSLAPLITYSDVQGGYAGTGNLEVDPLFALSEDCHLLSGSPCIDSGTNTPAGGLPEQDADGNPRQLDGNADGLAVADIGAYEFNSVAPTMAVSPTRIEIFAPAGQVGQEPKTLSIRNAGTGTMSWVLQWEALWLQADSVEGESNGEVDSVALTADATSLPHGVYSSTLTVSDPQTPNSPRTIDVIFYVTGTFHVPEDYPTIQAAIDATTVRGDQVVVADGVYTGAGNKDLDFHGKSVTLRSASGDPSRCIIDCQSSGRGLYFHSGETASAVVSGLTVRNGLVTSSSPGGMCGGGAYFRGSQPTLSGCVFIANSTWATGDGGGVYCYAASPILIDCFISYNMALRGGGLYCDAVASRPLLVNCTIDGNTGSSVGGGCCCRGLAGLALTGCTVYQNNGSSGAGVHCDSSSTVLLTNCTIRNNQASRGGGVRADIESNATLASCTISGNIAYNPAGTAYGGGVDLSGAVAKLTNCVLTHNAVSSTGSSNGAYGGAGWLTAASVEVTNCTIIENTAVQSAYPHGGGLSVSSPSATLTNLILWGNTPQALEVSGTPPTVTYCDIQGGWSGTGNIDLDPLLVDPDGADNDPDTCADNDYRLSPGSPCIDTGTNTPPDGLPAEDADGNPRPLDGDGDWVAVMDMGAYEVNWGAPSIAALPARVTLFARLGQTAQETQTLAIRNAGGGILHWSLDWGAAWLQAEPVEGQSTGEVDPVTLTADAGGLTQGIHSAMLTVADPEAANNPRTVEIVLYVGTELGVPSQYATIQAAINAASTGDEVVLAAGTYTGTGNKNLDFGGKAITVRSADGDPASCIIDCQGSGRGFYFHRGETDRAVVAGLTIRNGRASSGSPGTGYGGGVYCYFSDPTLQDCVIASCTATSLGGGVYSFSSRPSLIHCAVAGNTAPSGGGAYCLSSNLAFLHCIFNGNTASSGGGGGLYCNSSNPAVINCIISNNAAAGFGCGGGVYCNSSSPVLTNCTVSGNTTASTYRGGGLYSTGSGSYPVLANSILWGDTPSEIQRAASSGLVTVTYCDVQGGYTGEGNISLNPVFVDPDGADNNPSTWQDNDFRLTAASPCIDAGDNYAVPADTLDLDGDGDIAEPLPSDLAGSPRFADDPTTRDTGVGSPPVVDMGAYEYQPLPLVPGDLNCDLVLDFNDVAPFALALVDPTAYQSTHPLCDIDRADMNQDLQLDGLDIQAFVDALLGP